MRNELLSWFARHDLLLTSVVTSPDDDEILTIERPPLIALSRADSDFYACPDPAHAHFPVPLEEMTLDDMHRFISTWLAAAVEQGMGRCFVCNKLLHSDDLAEPWDAVFVTNDLICWLLVHFDCKRYLSRDLKGRHPFEVSMHTPPDLPIHFS